MVLSSQLPSRSRAVAVVPASAARSSSESLGSVSFHGSSWSPMRLVRGLLRKVPRLLAGSEVSVLG